MDMAVDEAGSGISAAGIHFHFPLILPNACNLVAGNGNITFLDFTSKYVYHFTVLDYNIRFHSAFCCEDQFSQFFFLHGNPFSHSSTSSKTGS